LNSEPFACLAGTLPLEPYPQPLFLSLFFKYGLASMPGQAWTMILLYMLAWQMPATTPSFLLVEMGGGSLKLLLLLASNCDPPDLHLLSSWITGVSSPCLAAIGFLRRSRL
jgi:hypothetical protein